MRQILAVLCCLALLLCAGCAAEPKTYPLKTSAPMADNALELPDIVFTTTGAENGLAGAVYYIDGKVDRFVDGSLTNGTETFVVTTDRGEVAVGDMYTTLLSNPFSAVSVIETISDYTLPSVGETVRVIATYAGYSSTLDMPIFYFGANAAIIDMVKG